MITQRAFNSYDNKIHLFAQDEVAEWLRRWTANPLGSARVGSNPILVDAFLLSKWDGHMISNREVPFCVFNVRYMTSSTPRLSYTLKRISISEVRIPPETATMYGMLQDMTRVLETHKVSHSR